MNVILLVLPQDTALPWY